MPTQNTPIRFTEGDRALIDELRAKLGYTSLAETIRHAVRIASMISKAETVTISVRKKKPKKSQVTH